MDFLNGRIKTIYFKYLSAAFGSALITSIYSIVDMAMVGQYHGPEGSAALAVVAPVWNIIYSLGLLMGIGGSVLFSTVRGRADGSIGESNEYFTASVIGSVILAGAIWLIIIFFDRNLMVIFGAQGNTLTLAREYVLPVKAAIPFFLFNQMLAAYLRNDKNPALATGAVLAGGIFNIFGDYFFVYMRYGCVRSRPCDRDRFSTQFPCHAESFFYKEKYSPACQTGGTCEKIKKDHCNRIFYLFYRRGNGDTDDSV